MLLSRVLAFPFALTAGFIAYQMYFNYRSEWSYYLIPFILAMVCIYIFHHQIDRLGWKWWPQPIDEKLLHVLQLGYPGLSSFEPEERRKLFEQLMFDIRRTEFTGMKVDDIPEDIKAMSIFPGSLFTHLTGFDFLGEYNRIILYKHPFPSPEHKEWHASEIHHEDGVLLFSVEQLIPGYVNRKRFYNVAFHEWSKALILHKGLDLENESWNFEGSKLSQSGIENFIGIKDISIDNVVVAAYFTDNDRLKEFHPEQWRIINSCFNTTTVEI